MFEQQKEGHHIKLAKNDISVLVNTVYFPFF